MKLISMHEIVNDLIEETNDVYENMRPVLMRWGVRAELKIDTQYMYRRQFAVLTVNGCCAPIPCNGVHVLGIILGDHGVDCGLYLDTYFNGNFKYDTLSFYDDLGALVSYTFTYSDGSLVPIPVKWHIEGDQIKFADNLDGQSITMCYLGYEKDAEGYPLVNESHRDALITKLKIMILEREKHRKVVSGEYINQISGDISTLKREYKSYVRQARAEDMDPSNSERNEIAAMLNNPLTGYGNYLLNSIF